MCKVSLFLTFQHLSRAAASALSFLPTDWFQGRWVKALGHFGLPIRHRRRVGADRSTYRITRICLRKASLSEVNSERSICGSTRSDTAPLYCAVGGNARPWSSLGAERKVNLPRQFAKTDHATQPNATSALMAPITTARRHVAMSSLSKLCGSGFPCSPPFFHHLCQYSPHTNHRRALAQPPEKHNH